MNESSEALIDRDLHELLGDDKPPDLIDRTLAAIDERETTPEGPTDHPHVVASDIQAGRVLTLLRRAATAAGIIIAAGLIIWIIRPEPDSTPEKTTPSAANGNESPAEDVADKREADVESPREPEAEDVAGIRKRLSEARSVTFTTLLPEEPWVAETSQSDQVGKLAGLLFADETELADAEPGKIVFRFEFHGPRDRIATVKVDEDGKASVTWPNGNESGTYIVPAETLRDVKNLLSVVIPYGQSFGVKRSWSGAHSGVSGGRVEFATSWTEWERIWLDHIAGSKDPAPPYTVDFETEMVVAVFGGAKSNSRGYFVDEILRGSTGWIVRIDETTYQTFGPADDVTPYGFFVFPRVETSVLVEENVQGELNKPPIWKQTAHSPRQDAEAEDALKEWRPVDSKSGKAEDMGLQIDWDIAINIRVVTEVEHVREWTSFNLDRADELDPEMHVIVHAWGLVAPGSGDYSLDVHGFNGDRLVVRVSGKSVQLKEGVDVAYDAIYGIWVLPRPRGELIVETPHRARNGKPITWQVAKPPSFDTPDGDDRGD